MQISRHLKRMYFHLKDVKSHTLVQLIQAGPKEARMTELKVGKTNDIILQCLNGSSWLLYCCCPGFNAACSHMVPSSHTDGMENGTQKTHLGELKSLTGNDPVLNYLSLFAAKMQEQQRLATSPGCSQPI